MWNWKDRSKAIDCVVILKFEFVFSLFFIIIIIITIRFLFLPWEGQIFLFTIILIFNVVIFFVAVRSVDPVVIAVGNFYYVVISDILLICFDRKNDRLR